MKNKIINVFVFIISLVLFISYLFIVAKHIDFFATKTLAYASIIELKEKESGDGTVITIQFQNQFKEKREEETLNLSNSFSKDLINKKNIQVFYTKYFSQVLIKDYENPTTLIFFYDLIVLTLLYFAIRAGLKAA